MRRFSIIIIAWVGVLAFAAMGVWVHGAKPPGEIMDYEVIAIQSNNWVVTAKETTTGNVVKFRLPPAVFKGKTFDANLDNVKRGERFSVRGPKNARLSQLTVEKPLPGPSRGQARLAKFRGKPGAPLGWEIVHVDARKWIVTAKNRSSRQLVKFRVDPQCFAGFRFRASLRGIGKGQGFSLLTPNQVPFSNCCTLLE